MVEFTLIAPIFLVLVLAILIVGVVVLNDVQLENGVRDGARAGGICGKYLFPGQTQTASTPAVLPNNQPCSVANLVAFTQSRITTIPGVTPTISVDFSGNQGFSSYTNCAPGQKITVTASYKQPLYAPLVGQFFGDPGDASQRTVSAVAEATCEQ